MGVTKKERAEKDLIDVINFARKWIDALEHGDEESTVLEMVELTTSSSFGKTASLVSCFDVLVTLAKWVSWTMPSNRKVCGELREIRYDRRSKTSRYMEGSDVSEAAESRHV
jgi:hypothetical protein